MCTLTIHRSGSRLLVTMNRDEARTRGPEVPPQLWHGGVSLLAPKDSDQGGTWMALNEDGVVACLLNKYDDQRRIAALQPRATFSSRGLIIPEILGQGPLHPCLDYVRETLQPGAYLPFTVVIAALEGVWSFTWHGEGPLEEQTHSSPWTMLSSSFFNADEVLALRREAFEAWLADATPMRDGVPAFNLYQPPGGGAWAPLMERDVSSTRSITQACVETGTAHHLLRWSPVIDRSVTMQPFTLESPVGNGSLPS
ncbi:MAG: NRDE family protein [Candidatus Hydrogenedentes bacterium]|nr:NRDE family protein [Candidatus Hydrogenedentota bacterium]